MEEDGLGRLGSGQICGRMWCCVSVDGCGISKYIDSCRRLGKGEERKVAEAKGVPGLESSVLDYLQMRKANQVVIFALLNQV